MIIEYEPDRSLITVSPQGPSRLQTDALAGLDERYLGQLLALAGLAGTLEVDLWNDLERREFFERALGRLGYEQPAGGAGAERDRAAPGRHRNPLRPAPAATAARLPREPARPPAG
nr:hypothetical protein GCM10020092_095870 [Actinoplanes digitatis]